MTADEFNRWLKVHEDHFPGVRAWLESMRPPDAQGVLALWWKTLSRYSFATAEQASEDLWHAGGGAYGDHPVLLRRHITERRAAENPAEDTGPQLCEATPEQLAEARSVLAEARAALANRWEDRP